ncbi:DEAD/DEAH box helicase [Plasticicumulans acidivorans]|uniref:SWIM zinc finger protein n=1 Tax=Plasticicumulans acidivorans TaxID=886464 RepID=A0A317MYK0_9GAMM|nr:DEAD/DEAH box helicase [Plasticicumulans acidivorans]PWV64759.1 SWIM zinc finger protein [Plasticicumulans acidivorans]
MTETTSSPNLNLWFDPLTIVRGEALFRTGGVFSLESTSDGGVRAEVRGNYAPRYTVRLRLSGRDEAQRLDAQCECPLGGGCKHVVAALLQLFQASDPILADGSALPLGSAPVSPALGAWLERLAAAALPPPVTGGDERLLYLLQPPARAEEPVCVRVVAARPLKKGGYGRPRQLDPGDALLPGATTRFAIDDLPLLRELALTRDTYTRTLPLRDERGAALLARLLASGRCHWHDETGPLLSVGAPRPAQPQWCVDDSGRSRLALVCAPASSVVLALEPPWYIDVEAGSAGPLETPLPPSLAAAIATAPTLAAEELPRVTAWLERHLPGVSLPPPPQLTVAVARSHRPQPRLRLYTREVTPPAPRAGRTPAAVPVDGAHLDFGYGEQWLALNDATTEISRYVDGVVQRLPRASAFEHDCLEQLCAADLVPVRTVALGDRLPRECRHDYGFHDPDRWGEFVLDTLPRLRADGWTVDIEPGFRFNLVEADDWFAELDDAAGEDWFGLALGVEVQGQRVNLLPCLVELIARQPGGSGRDWLESLGDERRVMVPLPDGRLLPVPAARIRAILGVLVELYDGEGLNLRGEFSLGRVHAGRLAELEAALTGRPLHWHGGQHLRELAERLRSGPQPLALPAGFHATLRPYQQQGLEWLQFLRATGLAGVLADDMGLGKTVQTLAHLASEHAAGRLDRPALIVAPTSLLPNWAAEAARFAPGLRVLALRGPERSMHFASIPQHDLILTTYALLPRDREALGKYDYHLLILDEAQAIKNPTAQAGLVARALKARHRLCLSGTPMENHLGELWSLFDFLLPGLLGDSRQFQRLFRKPIEKDLDAATRERLARRVGPFLLRRTKEQVAADLPPKTEIVRTIELAGTQRDLYEGIRLAMQERVRAEIASKGLARSHIVILDALLKLRQVCCDPRLVKLGSARAVKGSAKLELLTEMLPELVDEGRRVLVFSQFTQMLALIEKELQKLGLPYVILTGATDDRDTPVRRFQNGEVPVFLISLKAGGTGLNLTSADTVIHYDPWWNPAAEDQASDRAHRIGQDKPVFVYKLYTEGTVEEKIRDLQLRKRALVDGILGERESSGVLADEDLEALFAPLS